MIMRGSPSAPCIYAIELSLSLNHSARYDCRNFIFMYSKFWRNDFEDILSVKFLKRDIFFPNRTKFTA